VSFCGLVRLLVDESMLNLVFNLILSIIVCVKRNRTDVPRNFSWPTPVRKSESASESDICRLKIL
jgi:hypothetical protein